jgi:hypothetical protein
LFQKWSDDEDTKVFVGFITDIPDEPSKAEVLVLAM